MPAPKNNTNALKWTKEKSLSFLKEALAILKEDKEILFLGSLAVKQNTYRQFYHYILERFSDVEFDTIKKEIDSIIETRLYEAALKNKVNAAVAIFGLKNNHKWKDKREQEVILPDLKNITPLTFYKNEENEN
jgi:uncharacterized protein YgfB (UPF0149 family)